MRHGSSTRRTRSRGGNRKNQNNKNRVFDSSGPEVRIRGTAYQITEKYTTLAKDAASSGDHILAESHMQHAEHYQRMINDWSTDYSRDDDTTNLSDNTQNAGQEMETA